MGLIVNVLHKGTIDFPTPGCQYIVEDNIGDKYPIHIHFGDKRWRVRMHFTYKEFDEFCKQIFAIGEL